MVERTSTNTNTATAIVISRSMRSSTGIMPMTPTIRSSGLASTASIRYIRSGSQVALSLICVLAPLTLATVMRRDIPTQKQFTSCLL